MIAHPPGQICVTRMGVETSSLSNEVLNAETANSARPRSVNGGHAREQDEKAEPTGSAVDRPASVGLLASC